MKVKNSLAALKLSPLVKLASFVLLPLAAVLRFVQVYTLVDASTGFYTKSSPLTWAVNVLLIGGAAAIAVCCYLSKDAESLQPLPYKNTGSSEAIFLDAFVRVYLPDEQYDGALMRG